MKGRSRQFTREQIQQAIDDNLTQAESAERLGCSVITVRRWAARYGLKWPHHRPFQPAMYVEIRGEWLSPRQIADRYGVQHSTVNWRLRHGWRGEDLIAPSRCNTAPRDCYETPYSVQEWREIAAFAEERGIKTAEAVFGVPYGAVTAAMRGEDHRLG